MFRTAFALALALAALACTSSFVDAVTIRAKRKISASARAAAVSLARRRSGWDNALNSGVSAHSRLVRAMYSARVQKIEAETGRKCPEAASCGCHCDCPDTQFIPVPPLPPPCPVYPVYPTVEPTAKKPTPAPAKKKKDGPKTNLLCKLGEVSMSDGKCHKITAEIVFKLKGIVVRWYDKLKEEKALYEDIVQGKKKACKKCKIEYTKLRQDLLTAHQQYKRSLDMLLGWMALMKPEDAPADASAAPKPLAPEFLLWTEDNVKGAAVDPDMISKITWGRSHCEAWSLQNSTFAPTMDECGVICRNEVGCEGFTQQIVDGRWMCVWFDRLEPTAANAGCASLDAAAGEFYLKNRNVTFSKDIFSKLEVIHGLQELVDDSLLAWGGVWLKTDEKFEVYTPRKEKAIYEDKRQPFLDQKVNYEDKLIDANAWYFELKDTVDEFIPLVQKEAATNPPLASVPTTTPKPTPAPVVLAKKEKPRGIAWKDFPNSQDTKWSQRHPECPQGPPCFCDCKCRGVPPQNFVEPPPPAPAPCPLPPPTPAPSALSMPMGAPPALPLR